MKNIFISFGIFVVMIFTLIFSINYLNTTCKEINHIGYTLEENIHSDNWKEANKLISNLTYRWSKYSYKLPVFINHEEIDNITTELNKLTQYVKYNDKTESMASLHTLKFLFQHLINLERVNLQNIF